MRLADAQSDTSDAAGQVPLYQFAVADELRLPLGCTLVGVEITDDAVDLPSFKHPPQAAYVFGAERMSLSPAMLERCAHVVRIPTRFSINVGMAGAIVMYDRLIAEARFPARPVRPGGPAGFPAPSLGQAGAQDAGPGERQITSLPVCDGFRPPPGFSSRPNRALTVQFECFDRGCI